jgi:ferric iron reductase protein FhuF
MIELLKPIFHGPLAPYGEGLICSATHPPSTVRLAELLGAPGTVDTMLSRQALHLGTADLRPVASAWMLKYTALLLPPVAAAATLLKHVFPVDAREVAIELDREGSPQGIFIPHPGRSATGQDTASRYAPLFDAHLAPLVTRLSEVSNLPAKILWGNVARRLDAILDQATTMTLAADLMAEIETDRDYLLQQRTWPRGQGNPLFGRQQTVLKKRPDGRQTPILLHRQCCLHYLLPGENYCEACPLSLRFRVPESENR